MTFDAGPTAADYAMSTAREALSRAEKADIRKKFVPKNFKMNDLYEEIGRGVILDHCKICGAKVGDHEQHLRWHNTLNKVLSGWVPE